MLIEILVLIVLAIMTFLDIKYMKMPSFIGTATILSLVLLRPDSLIYGLGAFLFAYLLYEMFSGAYIGGWADIKVITIIGMMLNTMYTLAMLYFLVASVGMVYIMLIDAYLKTKGIKRKEIPFLPALFIVYVILLVTGAIPI